MTLANPLSDVTAFQVHGKVANPDMSPSREFITYLRALEGAVQKLVDEINRQTTIITVAELPTASSVPGARYIVSDSNTATFLAVVGGSGATTTPVNSNGTSWRAG